MCGERYLPDEEARIASRVGLLFYPSLLQQQQQPQVYLLCRTHLSLLSESAVCLTAGIFFCLALLRGSMRFPSGTLQRNLFGPLEEIDGISVFTGTGSPWFPWRKIIILVSWLLEDRVHLIKFLFWTHQELCASKNWCASRNKSLGLGVTAYTMFSVGRAIGFLL